MNKEELIELLKSYKENKARLNIKLKELKVLRIQLKGCEEIDTNITTAYGNNQDIHSNNKISNKVLDCIEKNETRKEELQKEIEELEEVVQDLREKVEAVNDRLEALKYKERNLLTAYYVDGRTAENISRTLYFEMYCRTCSERYIQKIIKESLKKIEKI